MSTFMVESPPEQLHALMRYHVTGRIGTAQHLRYANSCIPVHLLTSLSAMFVPSHAVTLAVSSVVVCGCILTALHAERRRLALELLLATALELRQASAADLAAALELQEASDADLAAALEAQQAYETDLATAQKALDVMNRAQRGVDNLGLSVPAPSLHLAPSHGWTRCTEALAAVDAGYARWAGRPQKTLLISNYEERPGAASTKRHINELIASHLLRLWPELPASLREDDSLALLLLEAPSCETTEALVRAAPALATLGHKIYVPQADPTHYAAMVGGGGGGGGAGDRRGSSVAIGLNVRCQRLDEWLCSNAGRGLQIACCFADFEASVHGRPKVGFAPLRDLQRFLRSGYAAARGCLLGVTLAFRDPHDSRYDAAAPRLDVIDLQAFVAAEARAAGLRCAVLETVTYGLTFSLFQLVQEGALD